MLLFSVSVIFADFLRVVNFWVNKGGHFDTIIVIFRRVKYRPNNNSKTEVTNLYSVQKGDQTGNSPEVGSVLGSHHGLNYIFDDILSKIKKKYKNFTLSNTVYI